MALKRLLMLAMTSAALTMTGCPGDDTAANSTTSGSSGGEDSTGNDPTITTSNSPTTGSMTTGADSSSGGPSTDPTTTDPGTTTGSPGGDCCAAHAEPGCNDMTCQDAVCAMDQFCCAFEWDMDCAAFAQRVCEDCGGAGTDSGDSDSGGATCGNGMLDAGEDCDGANLNGSDCTDLGFTDGTLGCDATCSFDSSMCTGAVACDVGAIVGCVDENPATCTCEACDAGGGCSLQEDCVCPDCATDDFCSNPASCNFNGLCDPYNEGCACTDCTDHPLCGGQMGMCGNGMLEAGEACDGADLGGTDCAALGFSGGGVLACNGACGFDTSGCIAGPFTCNEPAIAGCPEEDAATCTCQACDPGNGCKGSEDCTCPDCAADAFCSNPDNCANDGLCDPYFEGCICPDCADHPLCGGPPAVCGDGMVGGGEQCDGADLNGADCTTVGFAGGGVLACSAGCGFDTSGCIAGPFTCNDAALAGCTDEDAVTCTCEACDPGNGCEGSEDCTCPDCAADAFCSNPDNCANDGLCDPYFEGCGCLDCADHPLCP